MGNPKDIEDSSSIHSASTKHDGYISNENDLEGQRAVDTKTEEKTSPDPNIVDWDGPDDPANPMNWSSGKKVAAIGIVSLITMLS